MKPRALRPGALVAIVSPAGSADAGRVAMGVAALEARGYRTRVMPHALDRGPLYYAGRAQDRVEDLHAAFADPEVAAILCTRGGYGTAELLPHLDRQLIRAHLKPFIGYSDLTSLQVWLENECGLVSFYGPMVAAEWPKADGVHWPSWNAALTGTAAWSVGAEEGLRVLRPGVAEGRLRGGCLALLAESLGTPFALLPAPGILFLEDIGVKPYQWDRMLLHLRLAGLLEGVTGIVFGDTSANIEPADSEFLDAALLHALAEFEGPVAIGLTSGHVRRNNVTLPLGVRVRLELPGRGEEANPKMHFLEAAVEA